MAIDLGTSIEIQVATLRRARGWSLSELAEQAGVSKSTIHAIENGSASQVQADTLTKIAKAFDMDVTVVFQKRVTEVR